jgi:hypothetical protein
MMIGSLVRQVVPAATEDGRGTTGANRTHWLWVVLNAQALLHGELGPVRDPVFFEDDYRRLSVSRRATRSATRVASGTPSRW